MNQGTVSEKEGLKLSEALSGNDDIILRTSNIPAEKQNISLPPDRWNTVYFIMLLHGIAILMPWNMFITANDYFVKFKLTTNSSEFSDNIPINGTIVTDPLAFYQSFFLSFTALGAQIPNVLLNGINLFYKVKGGNISKRIVWSIMFIVLIFILTVFLAMADTRTWSDVFFWITIISVLLINSAVGIYQNSIYGMAAGLPMQYTNAIILGSNLSGIITTCIAIASKVFSGSIRMSAIYYFLCAIIILLLAFDSFFILELCEFYNHFVKPAPAIKSGNIQDDVEDETPPFLYIFTKGYKHILGVFFIFFVSLGVFPVVLVNVKPGSLFDVFGGKYYLLVTCFLNFNIFATLGSFATEYIIFPSKEYTWIPICMRVLFFPFFMMCNSFADNRVLPVWFENDYLYIAVLMLFAFTSGYYSSVSMMFAPKCVEPKHQGTAGMMAAFFLILGIFSGITFSLLIKAIILGFA